MSEHGKERPDRPAPTHLDTEYVKEFVEEGATGGNRAYGNEGGNTGARIVKTSKKPF